MSNSEESVDLEKRARAAEELLFFVLDHIDEPVVLDAEKMREVSATDRMIDLQFDEEENTWTLQVVTISEQ